jgi:hypothetical protein
MLVAGAVSSGVFNVYSEPASTVVTNDSFINNEVEYTKKISASRPFTLPIGTLFVQEGFRRAHYFYLENLDNDYEYSFRTTYANFTGEYPTDTVIALYRGTVEVQNLVRSDDDGGAVGEEEGVLSYMSHGSVQSNDILVVTSFDENISGPFKLLITRLQVIPS